MIIILAKNKSLIKLKIYIHNLKNMINILMYKETEKSVFLYNNTTIKVSLLTYIF